MSKSGTSNGVERLNEEIRRRERVIRIFPNRESVIRLVGALLMEIDEEWTTGRKHLNMDEYEAWKKVQQASGESVQVLQQLPKRSPLHSPKRAILHTFSDLPLVRHLGTKPITSHLQPNVKTTYSLVYSSCVCFNPAFSATLIDATLEGRIRATIGNPGRYRPARFTAVRASSVA